MIQSDSFQLLYLHEKCLACLLNVTSEFHFNTNITSKSQAGGANPKKQNKTTDLLCFALLTTKRKAQLFCEHFTVGRQQASK